MHPRVEVLGDRADLGIVCLGFSLHCRRLWQRPKQALYLGNCHALEAVILSSEPGRSGTVDLVDWRGQLGRWTSEVVQACASQASKSVERTIVRRRARESSPRSFVTAGAVSDTRATGKAVVSTTHDTKMAALIIFHGAKRKNQSDAFCGDVA